MIERLQTIWGVGIQDAKRHMRSQRMLILSPLIILTISMACWGFADARIVPAGLPTNTPSEVLFLLQFTHRILLHFECGSHWV